MKLLPFLAILALATGSVAFAQTAPVSSVTPPAQEGLAIQSNEALAFLGDSITRNGAAMPGGYVCLVLSGLKANGVSVTPYPAGIGGNKSNQMLERLDADVLSKKPTWMTLSCGVNDVWAGDRGIPLDQYKVNMTAIVDQAQAAGVKVMILTATMIGEQPTNPNNVKIATYNDFLRQLAKDKHCLLADLSADMFAALNPEVKDRTQLTVDGVHMNPVGDQIMATGVLRAFGMNETQLQKARNYWISMPEIACKVDAKGGVTFGQYQQLREMAAKQNRSIEDLASEQLTKALEKLVPPQLTVKQ
ncbi:MAG: SGNH/GDSL hydrolase family protein [Terrimicrobiaceae bacterium]